jgi:von Willebrand factor A domain-containing protein 7
MRPGACFLLVLVSTASAAAQSTRGQTPRRFTGPCASADPVYAKVANATGGQQYLLRGSEIEKSGAVMESKLAHSANILFASGVLRKGEPRDFQIPVDSTVESVSFSVTVDCKESIAVWRPSGDLVTPGGSAGFIDTEMVAARILTVKRPETGSWRIRVSGTRGYSVSVLAKSDLDLIGFDFVRLGGRPGHEGYFPIKGQPTSPDQTARARLSGPFQTATFKLLSEAGDFLQNLPLTTTDRKEFMGNVRLPGQAFRVAVEGTDERGLPYQRLLSHRMELQSIEITTLTPVEELKAGTTTKMSFQLRNLGTAGAFDATVVWVGRNFIRTPPPMRLALPAGGAAAIEADVDVPADATPSTELTISVAVTRKTPPASENGLALSVSIR